MFKTVTKLVRGTVSIAGEVVRVGAKVTTTVTSELIATPTELFLGENAFSDGVRAVRKGVNKAADVAVDVGAPVLGRVITAPLTKAEHVKDFVVGGVQTALGDEDKGKAKMKKAAAGTALAVLTFGIVDEDTMEMAGAAVEAVRDSLGDALETVAGAVGGAGEAVAGLLGGEAVADAGVDSVADVGDVLAAAGPDSFSGVGGGVMDTSEVTTLAAAPPPAPAMAAASTDAPSSIASHMSQAIRFKGEDEFQEIYRLIETNSMDQLHQAIQGMINQLPADVSPEILWQLQQVQVGDRDMVAQALTSASQYMKLDTLNALVHFSGSGQA